MSQNKVRKKRHESRSQLGVELTAGVGSFTLRVSRWSETSTTQITEGSHPSTLAYLLKTLGFLAITLPKVVIGSSALW